MIAAYSPQARGFGANAVLEPGKGGCRKNCGWLESARWRAPTRFCGSTYIGEFNSKFKVAAEEKGTAFRRTSRTDLNWIFTVQTERVVAKDNTVAIADRSWQIDQTRFRNTLAGRHGDHTRAPGRIGLAPLRAARVWWVGTTGKGVKLISGTKKERRGKGREYGNRGKPKRSAFHRFPHSFEIPLQTG